VAFSVPIATRNIVLGENMTKRTLTAILLTATIALLVGIRVGGQTGSRATTSAALPPAGIPTFSTENLGRMAHFYVGGEYVGEPGKEYMDGAMYVEVWVPKQVRQPYPIVMFHWQRTDRRRVAADARRPSRLGLLPD
jgi:hypothetical protein